MCLNYAAVEFLRYYLARTQPSKFSRVSKKTQERLARLLESLMEEREEKWKEARSDRRLYRVPDRRRILWKNSGMFSYSEIFEIASRDSMLSEAYKHKTTFGRDLRRLTELGELDRVESPKIIPRMSVRRRTGRPRSDAQSECPGHPRVLGYALGPIAPLIRTKGDAKARKETEAFLVNNYDRLELGGLSIYHAASDEALGRSLRAILDPKGRSRLSRSLNSAARALREAHFANRRPFLIIQTIWPDSPERALPYGRS